MILRCSIFLMVMCHVTSADDLCPLSAVQVGDEPESDESEEVGGEGGGGSESDQVSRLPSASLLPAVVSF